MGIVQRSLLLIAAYLFTIVPAWGQQEEVANRENFRRNLIRAAVKLSQSNGEDRISRADVLKIRLATMAPAMLEKAQKLAVIQMAASGDETVGTDIVPIDEDGKIVEASIDWDKLISFLERLVPIILQLIDAFSQDGVVSGVMAA